MSVDADNGSADVPAGQFIEEIPVEVNYDGWRLDRFLTEKINRTTRSQVKKYLPNVRIRPERRVKPGTRLRSGDVVEIVRRERILPNSPVAGDMTVLAEFGEIAVVNKPPGALAHRTSREYSATVTEFVRHAFPDHPQAEPVHRLDRETSGCLLVALESGAVGKWRQRFTLREIGKEYVAIVQDPHERWRPGDEQTIDIPLGPDRFGKVSVKMTRGELSARTDVRVVARAGARALLTLQLHEGRQHQIRVHLALVGTPVVGDKLYLAGDDYFQAYSDYPWDTAPLNVPFHCLHSYRVGFVHEGNELSVEAPLPPHFQVAFPAASDALR